MRSATVKRYKSPDVSVIFCNKYISIHALHAERDLAG